MAGGKSVKPTLIKIVAILLFLALTAVLAWDMSTVLLHEPGFIELPNDGDPKDFTAVLRLNNLQFDTAQRTGTARLALQAYAQDDQHPINAIAIGYRSESNPQDILDWIYFTYAEGQLRRFEELDPQTGVFVDSAELTTEIQFATDTLRPELWYPFDRHLMDLRLRACVNDENACLDADNLWIRSVTVDLDPGFDVNRSDGGELSISFGRRRFVKTISIVFLLLSVVFFVYLIKWTEGVELFGKSLGFLAGLWGMRQLIVPKGVDIFPTVVDYMVLLLFCGVFLVVLTKALSEESL